MSGHAGPLARTEPSRSPWLDAGMPAGVVGRFTTRFGGASRGAWQESNLSEYVGDDPAAVATNRRRLEERLGAVTLVAMRQVHGRDVVVAGEAVPDSASADALVTVRRGVALVVLAADCLPVLVADAEAGVVGAAHAGRVGLVAGVLQATLETMVALGASLERAKAVIGPGICGECCEVPAEMRNEVAVAVPGTAARTRVGSPALDLAAGAERLLLAAGVGEARRSGLCTAEDPRFYSHRRDGVTGRFAGVVMLEGHD